MKDRNCELATEPAIENEEWRLHAAGCPSCREHLAVADWMTTLARSTTMPSEFPAAGSLLFRARIQERLSAADRAARPIRTMAPMAGLLLLALVIGVIFSGETRLGSIMVQALGLLLSYAGVLVLAAVIVTLVCSAAAYLENRTKV